MRGRTLLALAVAALVLQSCLPERISLPESPALKWLERKTGRIAYVGKDGNIWTVDQAGGAQRQLTKDASISKDAGGDSFYYQYPVWSPDSSTVAFVSVSRSRGQLRGFGVWTTGADFSMPMNVYQSDTRLPQLLSWAPDSSRLVFLAATASGSQELDSVPAGGGATRVLSSGAAHAWRWARSSAVLAVHVGDVASDGPAEKIAILDPNGLASEEDLAVSLGTFEAPGWVADNTSIVVAALDGNTSVLYLAGRKGEPDRKLAEVEGGVTLDVSPDGRKLAYATEVLGDSSAGSRLSILDLSAARAGNARSATPRVVSGDDFVAAFFWSPDSSQVAYVVPTLEDALKQGAEQSASQSMGQGTTQDAGLGGLAFTLKVVSARGGKARTVATFQPSPFFVGMVRNFGQYAESLSLWSPDSKCLLYCTEDTSGSAVMVAYARENIAARKIADGVMATWSSK
jgi:Tol biopolymer transport system component